MSQRRAPEMASVPIAQLPDHHLEVAVRAIRNVLSTAIAEETCGQIIDGLPLAEPCKDLYESCLLPGHPLMEERMHLSSAAVDKTKTLRAELDPTVIRIQPKLLHDYQTAPPGSRAFGTRLIELVAVAIHEIAAWLHQQDHLLPADDEMMAWRPDEDLAEFCYPDGYYETFFFHEWYKHYKQYPQGRADLAGYWAENRIFGGVVLFDRRDPTTCAEAEPEAVYLHPDRRDVTYRIIKLLDEEKQQLLEFLQSDLNQSLSPGPLPFLGSERHRVRVDPEESIEVTGIYRDKWERNPVEMRGYDMRLKDVVDTFNYLSFDDWMRAGRRADDMWQRRAKEEEMLEYANTSPFSPPAEPS